MKRITYCQQLFNTNGSFLQEACDYHIQQRIFKRDPRGTFFVFSTHQFL